MEGRTITALMMFAAALAAVARTSKPVLNEPEAADHIGVSVRTLQRWRTEGIGPVYIDYYGSMIHYRRSDLDAFVQARSVAPKRQTPNRYGSPAAEKRGHS